MYKYPQKKKNRFVETQHLSLSLALHFLRSFQKPSKTLRVRFSRAPFFPDDTLPFSGETPATGPRWEDDEEKELSPEAASMSLTCPDCFSDLLCCEDARSLADDSTECDYSPDLEAPVVIEESIAWLVEAEGEFSPAAGYPARFRSRSLDAAAREKAVAWILKVHAFYSFQPLTAYLAINYMDRFLSSYRLPQENRWPLQLLCVGCLSLAAKMEESQVPSLLGLQVEGACFIFEPRTVMRMELLILTGLNWRLRSITPFSFIDFFACKLDSSGTFIRFLISRATQTILATLQVIDFLDFWPSAVAAAAVLLAANAIPNLSLVNPENAVSWCVGLSNERISSCYRLMQEAGQRKPPKVLQQLRVMTPASVGADSSSSSSSPSNKRRKLNNCLWADDGKEREQ